MRDRLADSRFEIIRLRFLSSTTGSEPELEPAGLESEINVFDDWSKIDEKSGSGPSQGVKPPSKTGNGTSIPDSEDNMAGRLACRWVGEREREREGTKRRGLVFMGKERADGGCQPYVEVIHISTYSSF